MHGYLFIEGAKDERERERERERTNPASVEHKSI